MKRFVIESIKGSFNLWIKAGAKAIGSFEPTERLEEMRNKNKNLGILEDGRGGYGPLLLSLVLCPSIIRRSVWTRLPDIRDKRNIRWNAVARTSLSCADIFPQLAL
jgi:hypothetical protein